MIRKLAHIALSFISMNILAQFDSIQVLDTITLSRENGFQQEIKLEESTLNFAEELERKTPVFIKNYGTGNLATVSYQGTSSGQNSLFWEDINLTPINSGTVDFSLIDPFLFSSYSFQSSQNNLQGSGIGADIVLKSNIKQDSNWHSSNLISLGSFSDSKLGLKLSKGSKKHAFEIALLGSNAENDFRFYNPSNEAFEQRENNRNQYVSGLFSYERYFKRTLVSIKSWNRFSEREIASPVHVQNQSETQHDVFSRNVISAISNFKHRWQWKQNLAYLYENYTYNNPKADITGFSELNRFNYNSKISKPIRKKSNTSLSLFGNSVQGIISEQLKSRYLAGFAIESNYKFLRNWRANICIRKEFYHQEKDLPLVADLSIAYQKKAINIYVKAQKNARKPTLNDLYWAHGGNPSLHSELAKTLYVGLQKKGNLSIQSEVYLGTINQMIVWLPNSEDGLWHPQNYANVMRTGGNIEIKQSIQVNKQSVELGALYAFTQSQNEAGKQLIYIPLHQFKTWMSANFTNNWSFDTDFQINGKRFVSADHTQYLPHFMVLDLRVSKLFTWLKGIESKVSLEIKNISNYTYYNIPFRPMPGRYFGLTLQSTFR